MRFRSGFILLDSQPVPNPCQGRVQPVPEPVYLGFRLKPWFSGTRAQGVADPCPRRARGMGKTRFCRFLSGPKFNGDAVAVRASGAWIHAART